MIKLLVAGLHEPSNDVPVTFRLGQLDANDVDVYANDDLIGWFELGENGIEFVKSTPRDTSVFSVDGTGYLTVR